ncbi:MAG: hypothetical protein R6U17_06405 [Thermoplasmata archaeon]
MNLALDSLLLGVMVVLAVTGVVFFLLAYINSGSKRVLILLCVFVFFVLKGALFAISDLTELLSMPRPPSAVITMDILIMGLLMISSFRE